ncbi:MAG: protease modulator HflK [Phycisphaerales bacterium]|nr:protease modulator HflK [Phycisphaerales bacterium]
MTIQNLPPNMDAPPPPEGSRFAKAHHILLGFLGLVLLAWLFSGIYKINTDQIAIVERLGVFIPDEGKTPGLHYAYPWPIDRVHKISIQQRRRLAVKAFNESPDAYADIKRDYIKYGYRQDFINSLFDPYLITGDKNVVHLELVIQYVVDDPEAWLSTVSHESDASDDALGQREDLFQEIVQHALTARLASMSVDDVLFTGQVQLTTALLDEINKDLALPDLQDAARTMGLMGVHIHAVDLVAARPPDYVKEAFNNVGRARAEAEALRVQGETAANTAKTQATAQQTTLILEAQAYREQVVNAAKGEADRFKQVFEQYEHSPDVTKWNLYVDAVKAVAGSAARIFFAVPGQRTIVTIDPPQFDANQARK